MTIVAAWSNGEGGVHDACRSHWRSQSFGIRVSRATASTGAHCYGFAESSADWPTICLPGNQMQSDPHVLATRTQSEANFEFCTDLHPHAAVRYECLH